MEFVAYVGEDKENWGQITALLNRIEAETCVLVMSKNVTTFPANDQCRIIAIDPSKPLVALKEELMDKLRPILKGEFEVSLSLASGNGKEHMALISALLNIPVGIKLAVYTKEGVQFLT